MGPKRTKTRSTTWVLPKRSNTRGHNAQIGGDVWRKGVSCYGWRLKPQQLSLPTRTMPARGRRCRGGCPPRRWRRTPRARRPRWRRRGWPSTSWWDTHRHIGGGSGGHELVLAAPVAHAHEQVQPRAAFQHVYLAAHIFAQRRRERVVLAAVSRLHATQVAAPRAVGHEAREHLLVEPGHRRVRAGEGLASPLKEGRGQHEVVHAQGGGERFRERAHVDDAAPVVHGGQRRQRALPVAEVAAVVVL